MTKGAATRNKVRIKNAIGTMMNTLMGRFISGLDFRNHSSAATHNAIFNQPKKETRFRSDLKLVAFGRRTIKEMTERKTTAGIGVCVRR